MVRLSVYEHWQHFLMDLPSMRNATWSRRCGMFTRKMVLENKKKSTIQPNSGFQFSFPLGRRRMKYIFFTFITIMTCRRTREMKRMHPPPMWFQLNKYNNLRINKWPSYVIYMWSANRSLYLQAQHLEVPQCVVCNGEGEGIENVFSFQKILKAQPIPYSYARNVKRYFQVRNFISVFFYEQQSFFLFFCHF